MNGSVLALSFAAAVVVLGFGIIMPFLPVYAQILGASTGLEIGLLSSAFLLTRTFLATFTGSASDRYGRKKIIIIGLLIYTVVSILFGLSQSWFELLLYRAVQGVASAMVWTPATALVADLTPPGSRGTAMGLYNSISMGGWVIGPALGGGIQWYARNVMMMPLTESFRIPFYFSSLTSLIAILLVAFFVRMPADYKPYKRPLTKISLRGVDKRFKSTIYAMFFLLFAYGFATSFIEPLLVYFVQHEYGLSADEVTSSMAIIFSVSGVLMLAIQIYAGRLADRFSKKKIIAIPTGLAQVFTMLMPFSGSVTNIGIVMTVRSAFYGMSSPAYTALQQDLLPRNIRGALTGVFDTFFGIGGFIGPIIGFMMYDGISHSSPFIVSGLLGIATVIMILLFAHEPTKEEAQDLAEPV